MRKYTFFWLSPTLMLPSMLWAASSAPESFTITAPVQQISEAPSPKIQVNVPPTSCTAAGQPLSGSVSHKTETADNPLAPIKAATPLYASGTLTDANQARALLAALNVPYDKPVIINIVWWVDPKTALVQYSQWYIYNPCAPLGYWMPNGPPITDSTLPGVTDFYFLYVHFYKDLGFSTTADIPPAADVFTYTVTITKQPSQFRQDLQTLAGLVNFPLPKAPLEAVAPKQQHPPGYYAYQEIKSQLDTSSIVVSVAAATKSGDAQNTPAASADQGQAPQKLTPNTYVNQPPSYLGLSVAMPITSYKDITYVPSTGTLGPTSVTRQNVYATLDFYYPPAVPDQEWLTLRWIPHPFIGLPLAGKVFEHSMAGIALGFGWVEAYAGEIYDTENLGPAGHESHTWERSYGIKFSVTTLAQLLKKGS